MGNSGSTERAEEACRQLEETRQRLAVLENERDVAEKKRNEALEQLKRDATALEEKQVQMKMKMDAAEKIHNDAMEQLRQDATASEEKQEQMKKEMDAAEKTHKEMAKRFTEDVTASEEKRAKMEKDLRAEMGKAAQKQREIEEQLRREKEEVERRQSELEEEVKREKERARAAEAAKELFEENWRKGIPPGVESLTPEQITQARSSYLDGNIHIAIVGNSGTGKSTLMNSIRGLKAKDNGAARVGQNECTRKTTRYEGPLHSRHMWYDVPGAGTLDIPEWQYFMDQELFKYDALVVVFSDRLMQNDVRVLRNAALLGIATFLVRSRSDQIILNMQNDHDEDESESKDRYIRETDVYARTVLGQVEGVDQNQKVYMISREGVLRAVKGKKPPSYALDEGQLLRDWVALEGESSRGRV